MCVNNPSVEKKRSIRRQNTKTRSTIHSKDRMVKTPIFISIKIKLFIHFFFVYIMVDLIWFDLSYKVMVIIGNINL